MKRLISLFSVLTLIFASVLGATSVATPAFASANDFYFSSFEADYYLSKNSSNQGVLEIEETLTAVFPNTDQNHGIERCIPNTYRGEGKIDASSVTVRQDYLTATVSKSNTSDGFLCLRIGDASKYVHGEVVYKIAYTYQNVIAKYADADYQELYWDTNGTSWGQKFGSLTARLHLPSGLYDSLVKNSGTGSPFSCYVGSYGASGSNRCQISESADLDGKVITFKTSNLSAGENLTFDATFTPGTFSAIEQRKSYLFFAVVIVEFLIFLGIFLFLKHARNKQHDKVAVDKDPATPVQYTPLKGVSVAEMAKNSMKTFSGSPFVATLMELATTHKIELEKGEKKRFGGYRWNVHVKTLDDVTREQTIVLEILNGGESVKVGDTIEVKSRYSTATLQLLAKSFDEKVEASLKSKGLFEKSERTVHSFVAIIFGLVFFIIAFSGAFISFASNLVASAFSSGGNVIYVGGAIPLIVGGVMFVAFLIFATVYASKTSKYKVRTVEGIKASKYLDGLKEYMTLAEKDRIKFLQSVDGADTTPGGIVKLYEKLLPYAVIFGLEESWMSELNKYYEMNDVTRPDWIATGVILSASDFRTFNSYATSAIRSSTMTESSGSSSGFSGGGGGGFSGGGGGGGGGGGW